MACGDDNNEFIVSGYTLLQFMGYPVAFHNGQFRQSLYYVALGLPAIELAHTQKSFRVSTLKRRSPARVIYLGDCMRDHQFNFLGDAFTDGSLKTTRAVVQGPL